MHDMEKHEGGMMCKCPHHKVLPLLVFVFGLTFLLGDFAYLSARTVSVVWPVLVCAAGFMKMMEGGCKCC